MVVFGTEAKKGGVVFRVILILLTLGIVMASIAFFLQYQKGQSDKSYRKATELAEFGLQQGLESFGVSKTSVSVPKTALDGGWYQVESRTTHTPDSLYVQISAQGQFGKSSITRSCTVCRTTVGNDTVWARLSIE